MLVSVITPVRNEEENIVGLINDVNAIFVRLQVNYEHIVVDNNSDDRTAYLVNCLVESDRNLPVKLIKCESNYGPDFSPYVGFLFAAGDVAIPVAGDYQDPISEIEGLLISYREDSSVELIAGMNVEFGSRVKRMANKCFYFALKCISGNRALRDFQGFGLYSRALIDKIKKHPYRYFYFRGLVLTVVRRDGISLYRYKKQARRSGVSNYSLIKRWRHGVVAINYAFSEIAWIDIVLFFVAAAVAQLFDLNCLHSTLLIVLIYLMRKVHTVA